MSILFSIFSPPFILGSLLKAIGVHNSIINWSQIIFLFVWLWFISPLDKLSKKEREEKNNRKVELIQALEKARKLYENKFK